MDLRRRNEYPLRVISFELVIKDTSGIVKYSTFVRGDTIPIIERLKMKEETTKLVGIYLVDFLSVHVTDGKHYDYTFDEKDVAIYNMKWRPETRICFD